VSDTEVDAEFVCVGAIDAVSVRVVVGADVGVSLLEKE
jgi:hypothetical protein